MTGRFHLRCLSCGATTEPTLRDLFCARCGGLFEVAYDVPPEPDRPLAPLRDPLRRLTLGEGGTPLIDLTRTAVELGLANLWAKLEYQSPTGSFKDRGSAVLLSAAMEEEITEFVEDSSGNAGASMAAYAAAAGIRAHVFVPASAARGKLDQIEIFGAELHMIEGPRQAATDAAAAFASDRSLVYLSHNLSPYFMEGMKSFSYEVAELEGVIEYPFIGPADHIVFPVGNGSLLVGAWKGFEEHRATRGGRGPRLHSVQAETVAPIVAALKGETWDAQQVSPTVASGISVSRPPRLAQAVAAVRETGGLGVAVNDESILSWQRRLATSEGIFCEATSAAAFAGLEQLLERGGIERGARVLVPVTGSGLKEPVR